MARLSDPLTGDAVAAIIGGMAVNTESSNPQAGSGWLTSRVVWPIQKLATRLRILLGAAGAVVLLAYVDRGPMWPGVLVVLGGELLQLWASAHLRKNVHLVKSGPYSWLRNPMYLGRFFVGLGLALLTWRSFIILAYVVGFWAYAQARVLGEEARLRELFRDEYEEFCRQVNRWLPKPPKTLLAKERGSWAAVWGNHQLRVTAGVTLALVVLKLRLEMWGGVSLW
jgi:protein-S-isoprenylcysteine O-methyltransferase Ste14